MCIFVSWVSSKESKRVIHQTLEEALSLIRNGDQKERISAMRELVNEHVDKYNEIKGTLPAHIFSGTFSGGHSLNNLLEYNRLLNIDIDKLVDNKMAIVAAQLRNDPYVFSYWKSPSGKGYKGLVKLDYGDVMLKDPAYWHKEAFHQLYKYFQDQYDIVLDVKCSDVPRLCFISYDPNLVLKPDAKAFPVQPIEEVKTAKKESMKHRKSYPVYTGVNYRRNEPGRNAAINRKIVARIIRYLEKNKLSITSSYYEWFSVAMAIVTTFNYDVGEKYFLRLCRLDGDKHDESASVSMLRYCYEHSNFEITLGTLLYFAQRKGYKFSYKAVPKRDTDLDEKSSEKARVRVR